MSRCPRAYLISRAEKIEFSCGLPDAPVISVGLTELAQALSSSRRWQELDCAALVVRTEPVPMLGILGYFNEAEAFSVESLAWQLRHWSRHFFYAGYQRVEDDCRQLAERLRAELGRQTLADVSFTAIPRGGLLVLGILSYFLDLRPDQLQGETEGRCLIVVDDCAISGARFHEFLSRSPADEIIFAHLYSHPELRRNIRRREVRVSECIAASDLNDCAAEFFGGGYSEWQKRWEERGAAYWNGLTERICFPWNETEVTMWNSISQRVEAGWRLMPSQKCFKNRHDMSRVQTQASGSKAVRVPPGILYAEIDDEVLIADTTTSQMYVLEGSHGDHWKAVVNGGAILSSRENGSSGRPRADSEKEFDRHLAQFVEAGLLEKCDEG